MRHPFPAVLALSAFALACAPASVTPLLDQLDNVTAEQEGMPQWPQPPAEARIRYLGSISTKQEFEPRPPIWRRIASAFFEGEETRLVRPGAVCVRDTTLAIADPGAAVVHVLDLYQRRWLRIERTSGGALRSPVGVACLPRGRLVVADSYLDGLWLYDLEGKPHGSFTDVRLNRPTGVVFDEVHGRIWVAETLDHRLRAFDLEGRELLRVGSRGTGPGQFNFPTMLAGDPDGGLWATDSLNFRLQHVDPTGRLDRSFGVAGDRAGAFARPRGLAVDASGRIFAVDGLLDAVQIFDPEGRLLLAFGGRGTKAGQFWLPSDVALDGQGHVFVVDSYNRRIQVFAYRPPTGA
jgi:DNA-binding beta-propeller fold protein YncE